MASKKVGGVLKFVGTVSLGLLTGTSYTFSALPITSLEFSPSSFRNLVRTTTTHLHRLATVSGSAFLLAFVLSPKGYRHPYLLYTSLFCFGTRLTDYITPFVYGKRPTDPTSSVSLAAEARNEKLAPRRMEGSYYILDDELRELAAEASENPGYEDGKAFRGEVEFYRQTQVVHTAVAGLGFLMAVLGVWGDGAHMVGDTIVVV